MIKKKQDATYDADAVFQSGTLPLSMPKDIYHTNKYFCADLSQIDKHVPTMTNGSVIAIVHFGLIPENWHLDFKDDIHKLICHWVEKYQLYLANFIDMKKGFSATDTAHFC